MALTSQRWAQLLSLGRAIEKVSLGWKFLGVLLLSAAAVTSHSVAVAGFGLLLLVCVRASAEVVWKHRLPGDAQHPLMRGMGAVVIALGLYITGQFICLLLTGGHPARSQMAIAWTGIIGGGLLLLSFGQSRVGALLADHPVLRTNGDDDVLCAGLAALVLLALALNAQLGWWWPDAGVGSVMVYYGFKEGWEALRA